MIQQAVLNAVPAWLPRTVAKNGFMFVARDMENDLANDSVFAPLIVDEIHRQYRALVIRYQHREAA